MRRILLKNEAPHSMTAGFIDPCVVCATNNNIYTMHVTMSPCHHVYGDECQLDELIRITGKGVWGHDQMNANSKPNEFTVA